MDYIDILQHTELFHGLDRREIEETMSCFQLVEKQFDKGEIVYRTGDVVHDIGLVLSGNVTIESDDIWGKRSILESMGVGDTFAENYAILKDEPLLINVVAVSPTAILFINITKLLNPCRNHCSYHNKMVTNLLTLAARKNLMLSRRIFHTTPKTIRGKLVSYLSTQSVLHNSSYFTIPFDRQQMADYLGVDRSALSNELMKMKRDGILDVHKNDFHLLNS